MLLVEMQMRRVVTVMHSVTRQKHREAVAPQLAIQQMLQVPMRLLLVLMQKLRIKIPLR